MAINHHDCRRLREALVAYMDGSIPTFAFDDENCARMNSPDEDVRTLSRRLNNLHDDMVDHSISVFEEGWEALTRIVAYLDTDLPLWKGHESLYGPFEHRIAWREHGHRIAEAAIPFSDPDGHSLPIHGRFDRIPSLVGFGILAVVLGALCLLLVAL